MAEAPDSERTMVAVANGAAAIPDAAAVLLFGSWARDRARPESDVDVAVLLDRPVPPERRLETVKRLVRSLARSVAADRLDVVILNDAPPALAFEILRHGRVVECRDPVTLHRFRVRAYRIHADYEPVERLFRARTARLASDG